MQLGNSNQMRSMAQFSIRIKTNVPKMTIHWSVCSSWLKDPALRAAITSTSSPLRERRCSTSSWKTAKEVHSGRTRKTRIFREGWWRCNFSIQHITDDARTRHLPLPRPACIDSKSTAALFTMTATRSSHSTPSQVSASQPMGRDELPIEWGPQATGFEKKKQYH